MKEFNLELEQVLCFISGKTIWSSVLRQCGPIYGYIAYSNIAIYGYMDKELIAGENVGQWIDGGLHTCLYPRVEY